VKEVINELQRYFPKKLYFVQENRSIGYVRISFTKALIGENTVILFFKVHTGKRLLRIIPRVMNVMVAVDEKGIRIYGVKQHPLKNEIVEIIETTAREVQKTLLEQKNIENINMVHE